MNATTLIEDDQLLLYFPFDNDTADYVGPYEGTNTGATYNVTGGNMYGAYEFDGINDDIELDDNDSLSFGDSSSDRAFSGSSLGKKFRLYKSIICFCKRFTSFIRKY